MDRRRAAIRENPALPRLTQIGERFGAPLWPVSRAPPSLFSLLQSGRLSIAIFDQQLVMLLEVRRRQRASLLGELAAERHDETLHRHALLAAARGQKGRIQHHVADLTAAQSELRSQEAVIDIVRERP